MQTWGAWSKRWGKSWGNSWGRIEDQAAVIGGGGRASGGKYNDPLIDQVLDKWAYIEEAQRRDTPIVEPIAIPDVPEADFGKIEPAPVEFAGPTPAIAMPFEVPALNAAPVPAIGGPLAPDLAERARRARARDDEEALLLILQQLV